jgi:hypothetical protein
MWSPRSDEHLCDQTCIFRGEVAKCAATLAPFFDNPLDPRYGELQ